jgi:chromate transport protein ChrA
MRTAQILKLFAYSEVVIGVFFAFKFFSPVSVEFWVVILLSFLLWLILRLFAIMGQLIFEIRNDSLRMLMNIERALYYLNSLTKEIKDLMDSNKAEKKTHENTSS